MTWRRNKYRDKKKNSKSLSVEFEIKERREKDIARKRKEIEEREKRKRKKKEGKVVKEKIENVSKLANNAFDLFQLWEKLRRANKEGFLTLFDTGERVHRSKAQGGHQFPKKNYPHVAFEVWNCYPISPRGNKRQNDMIGYERQERVIKECGEDKREIYKEIAMDEGEKMKFRSLSQKEKMEYYKKGIDLFGSLCCKAAKRIGIWKEIFEKIKNKVSKDFRSFRENNV